ncbi:hypothetical protein LMG26411_00162 [Cupriavidus numazuensis]|uniref:Uncharacterized protein n=1 Tax=Cupriavidus numazuensis TaxID=221992 RepID=A0ABM8T9W6_9BURK|nr:hypothetical protein LMG26411_00162 [Cupriavidus numazuensis]
MTHVQQFHPAVNPFFGVEMGGSSTSIGMHNRGLYRHDWTDDQNSQVAPYPNVGGAYQRQSKRFVLGGVVSIVDPDSSSLSENQDWVRAAQEKIARDIGKILTAQILAYEEVGNGRAAARIAIRYIERSFNQHDVAAVSRLLVSLEPSRLSGWTLVAVLRTSFRARRILTGWQEFLRRARIALVARGEPAGEILYGMED